MIGDDEDRSVPNFLSNKLKSWARYELKVQGSSEIREDENDPSITLREFLARHIPDKLREIYPMASQPIKQPTETDDAYERRLVIWQANEDTRRLELRRDRRVLLQGGLACTLMAMAVPWVVGVLAICGVEHIGLLVPGIITTVVLAAAAIFLFHRMLTQEKP